MDMLHVERDQIVDATGAPVRLRGVFVGAWMNMENWMNGYPGTESGIRRAVAHGMGDDLAGLFFERLLDHILAEADIEFIAGLGCNLVRLALNYRHFESDDRPFEYLEDGFKRLDKVIDWCEGHGVYAVLDLHAVQGWQNPDWHCDNSTQHALLWHNRHFQDRFVGLWETFARRYKGRPGVAGYDLMNEPVTSPPLHGMPGPDWDALNQLYRRTVDAIRAIDGDHIIVLEGDQYGSKCVGLEPPFADNLVYSNHHYNPPTRGPGVYPGEFQGEHWDRDRIEKAHLEADTTNFSQHHGVPQWVGEFGSLFIGPDDEAPDRVRALDDQIGVYEEHGAHWCPITYKDVGPMGWLTLSPTSPFMAAIAPIQELNRRLGTNSWTSTFRVGVQEMTDTLAAEVKKIIAEFDGDASVNPHMIEGAVLHGYAASLLQPLWARCFADLDAAGIEEAAASWAFENCRVNEAVVDVIRKHCMAGAAGHAAQGIHRNSNIPS